MKEFSKINLDNYRLERVFSQPKTFLSSHLLEIWQLKSDPRKKLMVKSVEKGLENSLVADLIGQRIFKLFNLPVPETYLIKFRNQLKLVMEYLKDYLPIRSGKLPKNFIRSKTLQSGILLDILLGHYDRYPFNLMYKDDRIVFIDFGGSLTSSPSGKIKGFLPKIDNKEIYRDVKAYDHNREVNSAYGQVIKIDYLHKKFRIVNRKLINELAKKLKRLSDETINNIIEEAAQPFLRRNKGRIDKILKDVKKKIKIPIGELQYPHHHQNYIEAEKTYQIIKDQFNSNEVNYWKYALRKRRDDLINQFNL